MDALRRNTLATKRLGAETINLRGINLELSSACNLNCVHCFRKTYKGFGKDEFLSLWVLEKILPEFKFLETVDLTGWGEPLLHPEFGLCLKKIRENFKGQLSLTTNGLLLDLVKIEQILVNQLDIICFSVDASDMFSYQQIRGGFFQKLEQAIRDLVLRKRFCQSPKPKIFASFLLRRSRLDDLLSFVEKMEQLGVEGIIFQQKTGVFSIAELNELTYSGYYDLEFEDRELEARIEAIERKFQKKMELIKPEKIFSNLQGGCGAFPLGHFFIKANGEVSPCCVLGYPVLMLNRQKELRRSELMILGDIHHQTLGQIWESPDALAFQEEMRIKGFARVCGDCIGLYLRRDL